MKKFKNENGVLVVEASIVLFFLIFFMLFIWNFAGVFATQNAVSHAATQTVQSIAADNMVKELTNSKNTETVGMVDNVASVLNPFLNLFGFDGISSDLLKTYHQSSASQQQKTFEKLFYYYLTGETEKEGLKKMHIDSVVINLDGNAAKNGTVKAEIIYVVNLRFGVFGFKNIKLTKYASCNLFGYSGN